MAILIKGMEMPKNCAGCFLRVGQCSRRIYMVNRPSDCPLNEVPEPHGRLIDADKLMKRMWDETDCMISVPATFVRDAPTVIQASEEGE